MNRLASRLSSMNVTRKEHPLTNDELMHAVPGIFSEDKHDSRSDRYTHIPTITVLDKLREEGFLPFFACQTRTHDEGKRGHTKHMMRLCRAVPGRLQVLRSRKSFCSIAMMVAATTR